MDFSGFLDKCAQLEDPLVDISRTERLLAHEGNSEFEGLYISSSKISSIRRFYESTNDYNKLKVANLINTNIDNITKVHKIVIDYEKTKIHLKENNYGG